MLKKMYKDPLIRRFVSGSLFAAAFVWVAVESFGVDLDIVYVFFIYSIGFVVLLMLAGLLLWPLVRVFRRPRSSLLDSVEKDSGDS